MKDRLVYAIKLIIGLVSFFSIGIITRFILSLFNINMSTLSDKNLLIIEVVISIIMFIILLLLYYKEIKEDFKLFKSDLSKNISYVVKMFIIFIIVKYVISIISLLILMGLGYDVYAINSVNQSTIESFIKISPILMTITCSFIGPFYEEVLFRMGMKKMIGKKYMFIISSGLLFGLLHIFPLSEGISLELGIIQSISYVTMGIFFAYVYEKNNNIFTTIGLHFLNNFISVLIMINMI